MIEPPAVVTLDDWRRCSPWIEAALLYGHGTHELADVAAEIEAGRAVMWPFEKSVCITEITRYPKLSCLYFWLAGGDMEDLFSHHEEVVDWGRRQGCTRFAIIGRKGWMRAMERFGYRPGFSTTFRDDPKE